MENLIEEIVDWRWADDKGVAYPYSWGTLSVRDIVDDQVEQDKDNRSKTLDLIDLTASLNERRIKI